MLSANGIQTYLFEDLRPTPELSFSVRELGCDFGIVLTASHNPKEYNGYKVYWNDGGQLVPPHDKAVIGKVRSTGFEDIRWDANESLIETVGAALDEKYTDMIASLSLNNAGKNDLNIVFTALHGTSIVSVPPALAKAGFTNVQLVKHKVHQMETSLPWLVLILRKVQLWPWLLRRQRLQMQIWS